MVWLSRWGCQVINPWRACAARVTVFGLCVCVCVCVCVGATYMYSRTTRNMAAKKRYQQVQYHTGLIFKMVIFMNPLCSKVIAWNTSEKANMLMSTASPQPVFAALHSIRSYLKVKPWGEGWIQTLPMNTYMYSYPVGVRKDRLWVRGCELHACTCIYIGNRMRV